ncbi:methyl-accepting chemotaxis protein [Phaeovulum vinaykumarii]|uniref:Methyl-accepting chemotaxis sensory transducer with Pas/Pac sensor n=1 Tax=Phaeovulum vinaykumarii TaxID=407234 RepID=A0A1N7MU28_9RHOB|nr:methyl-accepting chemotaxis protein [Phaeovulum vinaykumarii]SIS89562.1 methyl-accepting chemotaxis sensory transducer with Pas/Pac sensor [Phaeovulum vinaykumarii]SOC18387.1 methyl-accepting chemotaxis sensory transducer with Pas/Pac sensor [Phaeovulum vinaykumarii]
MRFLNNLKLTVKLPLMLVLIAAVSMAITSVSSYRNARALLEEQGRERLASTLDERHRELETWQNGLRVDVKTQAGSLQAERAMREFLSAWNRIEGDRAAYFDSNYQSGNPHPLGQREKLDYPGEPDEYGIIHRRYQPVLRDLRYQKGYHDIFLIDPEGNIVFTVSKEADFGTNLLSGRWRDSELAHVARSVLENPEQDLVESHFETYAPSAGAPAAFLAAPVKTRGGRLLGVFAVQISNDVIDAVLSRPRGLGETGQGYLVPEDRLVHNNLRLSEAPTMLNISIDTEAVRRGLSGEKATFFGEGHDGRPAVLSVDKLNLFGTDYALVVEQGTDELFAPATELGRELMMQAIWVMGALMVLAYLMSRSIARPLKAVGGALHAISARQLEVEVPHADRRDEVGEIARALDDFRFEMARNEDLAQDAALKGAAFEGSSAAMMMVNPDFVINYYNTAVTDLIRGRIDDFRTVTPEIDPDRLLGQSMDIFHNDNGRIRAFLSRSENLPYRADIIVGQARMILNISEVIRDDRRIGLVIEWRDVTEERMNRSVLKAIDRNQLIAEFDADWKLMSANDNLVTAMGSPADAMKGAAVDRFLRFVDPADPDASQPAISELVAREESLSGRFIAQGADGQDRIFDGSITNVLDRRGLTLKIVMMANDVTEEQRKLKAAEDSRLELSRAQAVVVDALRKGLTQLSEGDLSAHIDTRFSDEYEQLRADFNTAAQNLRRAIETVIENAIEIEGESREISNAAEDLSRRTEQQAATLEETAAALNELTESVKSSAAGANEANRVVSETRANAEASGVVVEQAVTAMGEIENSSTQISKIISVIDDIAFQTNLLALNAGVEAARAGEAGRGFAVVASEVRALAQRSSEAAREIDALISTSSSQVRKGVDLVGEAGSALKKILAAVNDVSARVSEIAASSQEQSSGLAEINVAVNQLDQVTQQNAAMFEETTAASHSLSRSAENLSEATSRFRTGGTAPARPAKKVAPAAKAPSAPKPSPKPVRSAPEAVPAARKPAPPAAKVAPPPPPRAMSGGGARTATAAAPASDDWEDF